MYKLEIKPTPGSEASTDEYNFVVNDLVASISDRLSIEKGMITKEANSIVFECEISEKDIKEELREVFTCHSGIMRYVNIRKF